FFSGGRQVALKSEPITIKVKPLPGKGRPAEFSGTVGQWALSARLDRQTAKVGEAVTLEIRIFGEGNVKSVGKIELPPMSGFKVYDTISSADVQKQDYRVRGVKTYRTLLRPEVTGTLTVPPITYHYFDPKTDRFEKVQVPALLLKVSPGEVQNQVFPATGAPAAPESSAPGVKVMAKDIRYLKLAVPLTGADRAWPPEFWITGFLLPPLLLAGIWFWRRRLDRLAADPVYARKRAAGRSARAALHQAHLARNRKDAQGFYTALSQALMGYLADKLGLSRSGVTQREIVRRLSQAGGVENKVAQLTELLDECDFARFAPGDREAAAMEKHETLAENLLTDFSRMLEKERKS
ncbi:MAG: protein BatD, partial [Candidatus Firestonebacteria bacterium]|nr:protein BatD [Candidatus Firestonebacteria bacterium]